MAITDNGNGLSAADVAAVVGNGNGNGFGNGFWGDGSFWIIILFLFAFMSNGFGGYGGGNMPYVVGNMDSGIQRGFDQQAVISGINGLSSAMNTMAQSNCNGFNNLSTVVNNGFSNAEIANNARQIANMQAMNGIAMGLQQSSCDNRAATADLKYTVATEACNDRAAVGDALNVVLNTVNNGIQSLKDQMCQDKIDAKNERIAALENQINMAQLRESQTAQTAQLLANNNAQTQALEQYLNPTPIPAYLVQNPNGCNCGQNFGCGCGM